MPPHWAHRDLAGQFFWTSFWLVLPSHDLRLDFRRPLFSLGGFADRSRNIHRNERAILQTVLYSLVWLVLAWIIGLPIGLLLYILFAINPLLGEGALLILGFLSMWLIVPIFFSSFGIYLHKQNVFMSFLSGFQMTRFALPTSSLFVLTMLLIGVGLNFLWPIPENTSWLTLVGILGHAFIMTALLASSFVYYRDTTAWLQSVIENCARLHQHTSLISPVAAQVIRNVIGEFYG